jgi:hypothetical protein
MLLGQVLWCFVREEKKTPLGELVSLSPRWKGRKSKGENSKDRSEDRRKVPGRPHSRPVQSGEGKGDGK